VAIETEQIPRSYEGTAQWPTDRTSQNNATFRAMGSSSFG
jgi:hypothetical protein